MKNRVQVQMKSGKVQLDPKVEAHRESFTNGVSYGSGYMIGVMAITGAISLAKAVAKAGKDAWDLHKVKKQIKEDEATANTNPEKEAEEQ